MVQKPMKLLIVEDDINACNAFASSLKTREEFELLGITDSDIDALKYIKFKHPEGIILDIELNNSSSGNPDTFELLETVSKLGISPKPIIIVTTYINSSVTYDLLHKLGADIILYKNQPKYSAEHVLNKMLLLRNPLPVHNLQTFKEEELENDDKLSECIYHELDLIGIVPKLIGRRYIHDAVFYLIKEPDSTTSVITYLAKLHNKAPNSINNGIKNAIIHAWRVSAIDDLTINYTAKVNFETGIPTPMELVYFYSDKVKKLI